MRIWIMFLAALACWCAASATYSFIEGDELWGWINAACVGINLVHMGFWVLILGED